VCVLIECRSHLQGSTSCIYLLSIWGVGRRGFGHARLLQRVHHIAVSPTRPNRSGSGRPLSGRSLRQANCIQLEGAREAVALAQRDSSSRVSFLLQ